jgi:N-acetylneuraminic acid mutarotase
MSCEAVNGNIYVFGGYDNITEEATDQVFVFKPECGAWISLKKSFPRIFSKDQIKRTGQATTVHKNEVFNIGGLDGFKSNVYYQSILRLKEIQVGFWHLHFFRSTGLQRQIGLNMCQEVYEQLIHGEKN